MCIIIKLGKNQKNTEDYKMLLSYNKAVKTYGSQYRLIQTLDIIIPRFVMPNLMHQSVSRSSCSCILRLAFASAIRRSSSAMFSALLKGSVDISKGNLCSFPILLQASAARLLTSSSILKFTFTISHQSIEKIIVPSFRDAVGVSADRLFGMEFIIKIHMFAAYGVYGQESWMNKAMCKIMHIAFVMLVNRNKIINITEVEE